MLHKFVWVSHALFLYVNDGMLLLPKPAGLLHFHWAVVGAGGSCLCSLSRQKKKESACQSNVGKYLLASGLNTAKLHDSLINQKQSNQLAGLVSLQPPPPPTPCFVSCP